LSGLLNEAATRQKTPFIAKPIHSVQPLTSAKSGRVFKEFTMTKSEQKRFDELYRMHLRALRLQGMSDKTIDAYSRAVRRISAWFDCCPDRLEPEQLAEYFSELLESHSWSTVKHARCGLQFFYKHVLDRDWQWVEMIRPPKIRSLPDILSVAEIERLIAAARKLRYRVFVLTTYSMGLRLGEALALEVGDIDADRHQVHIRRGKGHKDRLVPLPDLTCRALRALWSRHRHPRLLFPNASGSMEAVRQATGPMDRSGVQSAMKKMLADCGIKKKPRFIPCAIPLPPICLNRA
jgi:integrase